MMSQVNVDARLYPKRSSDRYYVLVKLRNCLETQIRKYVEPLSQARAKQVKILDFGCGDMPYRSLFTPLISEYIGADIAGQDEDKNSKIKIDPLTGNVPLRDKAVDIVLSTQVLEHVLDPKAYLYEAKRVCKEDGVLLLSTHGMWKYHAVPDDYWRWTAPGLRKLLDETGWIVVDMSGILGFSASALLLFQDALLSKLRRFMFRKAIIFVIHQMVGLLDLLYSDEERLENASVYFVVAKPKV
jgi:SAM-dependent methyltransferase